MDYTYQEALQAITKYPGGMVGYHVGKGSILGRGGVF